MRGKNIEDIRTSRTSRIEEIEDAFSAFSAVFPEEAKLARLPVDVGLLLWLHYRQAKEESVCLSSLEM